MTFDWAVVLASIPILLGGLKITIIISVVGLAIGFALALPVGLLTLAKQFILRWPVTAYVEIFRGTPVLVQALFIFYGLPEVFGNISPIQAGIAAIALNSSAYFAEVIRGGVKSIDRGQTEAALASGLSSVQSFRYVVWPQALRRMIPGIGDLCIVCIKDTSVFSIIGVGEIVRQGQIFIATNFKALEVYLMVAVLYLCVTLSLAVILRTVERRINVGQ